MMFVAVLAACTAASDPSTAETGAAADSAAPAADPGEDIRLARLAYANCSAEVNNEAGEWRNTERYDAFGWLTFTDYASTWVTRIEYVREGDRVVSAISRPEVAGAGATESAYDEHEHQVSHVSEDYSQRWELEHEGERLVADETTEGDTTRRSYDRCENPVLSKSADHEIAFGWEYEAGCFPAVSTLPIVGLVFTTTYEDGRPVLESSAAGEDTYAWDCP